MPHHFLLPTFMLLFITMQSSIMTPQPVQSDINPQEPPSQAFDGNLKQQLQTSESEKMLFFPQAVRVGPQDNDQPMDNSQFKGPQVSAQNFGSFMAPKKFEWPVPPPRVVENVDLSRYIGKWYQQAWIPAIFQIGCEDSTAQYSLNEDGSIKVNNTCFRFNRFTTSLGRARIDESQEPQINSKLLVSFEEVPGNVEGQYWIVRLGEEYEYAVVSDSQYQFLWILYRQPEMPDDLYEQLRCSLAIDGFPIFRLQRTKFKCIH